MPNFFKRAWQDIVIERKNIESYIVLAAIVIVIFADIVGVDTAEILIEIVLAVLGVFIYISIEHRHSLEQLKTNTDETRSKLQAVNKEVENLPNLIATDMKSNQLLLSKDLPDYSLEAAEASTIDVLSWVGYKLFYEYDDFFLNRLANGCKFRWIALDPESEAMKLLTGQTRNEFIKTQIGQVVNRLRYTDEQVFRRDKNFQLRLTSWLLPCSIIIFDRDKAHAFMVVAMYPAYLPSPIGEKRYFVIYKRNQPHDFSAYLKQFDQLWDDTVFTKPFDGQQSEKGLL